MKTNDGDKCICNHSGDNPNECDSCFHGSTHKYDGLMCAPAICDVVKKEKVRCVPVLITQNKELP